MVIVLHIQKGYCLSKQTGRQIAIAKAVWVGGEEENESVHIQTQKYLGVGGGRALVRILKLPIIFKECRPKWAKIV